MPTTFKVRCPFCSQKHAIPAQFVGKVVLCQPCGKSFLVEADPNPPAPKPAPAKAATTLDELELDKTRKDLHIELDPSESELVDLDAWDKIGTIEEEFD